jgi:hypothetical protein
MHAAARSVSRGLSLSQEPECRRDQGRAVRWLRPCRDAPTLPPRCRGRILSEPLSCWERWVSAEPPPAAERQNKLAAVDDKCPCSFELPDGAYPCPPQERRSYFIQGPVRAAEVAKVTASWSPGLLGPRPRVEHEGRPRAHLPGHWAFSKRSHDRLRWNSWESWTACEERCR